MTVEFVREEHEPLGVIVWFQQHTDLRRVGPGEVVGQDHWLAYDGDDVVAVALVERLPTAHAKGVMNEVYRLGVVPERRGEGIGSRFLDHLNREYGALELVCRESLPANDFYAATGWERTGVRPADPEDLVEWVRREALR